LTTGERADPFDTSTAGLGLTEPDQLGPAGQWVKSPIDGNDFKALPRKLGQLGQSLGHL
jgi:hypothetical protein